VWRLLARLFQHKKPRAVLRPLRARLTMEELGPRIAPATWDGGGADNNWSTLANWTNDVLPGANDDAIFDNTSIKHSICDAAFPGTVKNVHINTGFTSWLQIDRDLIVTQELRQR